MKHRFIASRDRAQGVSELPIWEGVYRDAFPGYHDMICHPSGQHWGQYAGIDRTITLASGTHILVDEKHRYKPYDDVLLEYWANKEKQVPGWIELDLACDFITYAVLPLGVAYLLPYPLLRRAWLKRGGEWRQEHKIIYAKNDGYTSESVAVPVRQLSIALVEAMRVTFEPLEIRRAS